MRGILWILASCITLSGVSVCSRSLGADADPWQLSFARSAIGFLAIIPWLLRFGLKSVSTQHLGLHVNRAIYLTAAMYCGFYGFTHLPLADATGLYFARPLFIVVLSALWLGQTIGSYRWIAVVSGFLGMLLVIRPASGGLQSGAWIPALGSFLIAVALLQVKRMQNTESDISIMFYSNAFGVILSAPFAWVAWHPLGSTEMLLLGLAGFLGVTSQACMVKAYRNAEPSMLAPLEYLQIPFTIALAFALFDELPAALSIVGILVIVTTGLLAGRKVSQNPPSAS